MSAGMTGAINFERCWHPTMHISEPRIVVNGTKPCDLCGEPFLPDSGQRRFCARDMCREARAIWAAQDRQAGQFSELARGLMV